MKTHLPVRINDIAAATGLSRATIDRVMNKGLNNIIVFREEPCS
jgi:predicted DNA-binding transcriptional regulator AlpA